MTELSENNCPLCRKNNHCGALDKSSSPCWCFSTKIPEQLIAKVPENLRRQACICQACVEKHQLSWKKIEQELFTDASKN